MFAKIPVEEMNIRDLCEAIDALGAFDRGATDSGSSDPNLRAAVLSHLGRIDGRTRRMILAMCARRFLTDDSLAAGYGLEDVANFTEWLKDGNVATF